MNSNQVEAICDRFHLGATLKQPERVYGGLLHTMWRFDNEAGIYAVKQLSENIDLNDKSIIENYNLTEKIASRFIQKGIPAICAIEQSNGYLLMIDDVGFLVYPWSVAKTLDKDAISKPQALQISVILARMHDINLNVPEILSPQFDVHSNEHLVALVKKANEYQCPFYELLNNNLSTLLEANTIYHQAIEILKKHFVVSHGDLDQKNVLWDEENNPLLIDWESARKLNPTYEIVNAGLDWSGITSEFNQNLFKKMIEAYQHAGGIIDNVSFEASFYGVLGNWINWLVYNIERSCGTSEQRVLSIEQVLQVLPTITRLKAMIPKLLT